MKIQKAYLLQLIPNQGETIPLPTQAHLYITPQEAEPLTGIEVPSLEN